MAKYAKVTDDELDLLTDEERIGLKEYQADLEAETAEEDAMIAAAAAGDPEDPEPEAAPPPEEEAEEDEPATEEEPVEEEDPPAEEEAEEEDEEQQAVEEPEEAEEDEPRRVAAAAPSGPTAIRLTPAEESRFSAIDTALDAIAVQFDDGEITAKEMRDQSKALIAELDALKEKRAVAKMSSQVIQDAWFGSTVPLFLAEHPEYVDGSLRHRMLDALVRDMQLESPNNPTDARFLIEAHKRIVAELGAVETVDKPVKKKKVKKPNGNGREMPPSINNIPASDQTPVTAVNKFARLEKLKGADYERALSKLSPVDREAYLMGA
jgi:hypothetical protein